MMVKPGERIATDGIIRRAAPHWTCRPSPVSRCRWRQGRSRGLRWVDQRHWGIEVEVTSTAEDNSLARIVHIVEAEQSRKGASQRLADRIAKPLVPGIMITATLIAVIGSLLGDPPPGSNAPWSCSSPPRRARWRFRCR